MEKERIKALIELSSTPKEADAIIMEYNPLATLGEKIEYLHELFDCDILDKSNVPDELMYNLLLEAIINAKYES